MAIQDSNAPTTPEVKSAPVPPVMNYGNTQQQAKDELFSFHASSLIATNVSENPGSDRLIALDNNLSKALAASEAVEFKTIRLESGTTSSEGALAFSMLVVVGSLKSNKKMVGYHTLIVEGTAEAPKPRIQNYQGENIEEHIVTSAAYDDIAVRMIERAVREANPNCDLYSADSMVIPETFNVVVGENDDAGRNRIQRLAANVALAIATELQTRQTSFAGLNMRKWQRDGNLIVTPRFERGNVLGVDELPRRQDIRVELSSQLQRQNGVQNQSINNGDRTTKISGLSAFVDLIWAPAQQQQMYGYVPQNAPKQLYAANVIVTAIENGKIPTIGGYLLALSSIRAVTESNNWYATLRSNGVRNPMTDIGYLNIEANIENNPSEQGAPVETSVDTFTPAMFVQYLNNIIRPGAMISIDIPDSGPESWALAAFSVAASNHAMAPAARKAIYNQALLLTGGAFGQYFAETDQMFQNEGNRIHMGYYRDRDGRLCDIREVDYIAVASMTKDREQIKLWSDTFTATSVPLYVRLARRKRIISAITMGGDPKFSGFANRVTFSKKFTDALWMSLANIGVQPRLDGNAFGFTGVERGVANWVDGALQAPSAGGFFTSGSGMLGGSSSYVPYNNNRF